MLKKVDICLGPQRNGPSLSHWKPMGESVTREWKGDGSPS
uniref:Uncharacterized protein n=1 Tax=Anguilla anguilla TaxID=7936 RepID=A0A0E9U1P5_ANGAN